jgi:plastocyanin
VGQDNNFGHVGDTTIVLHYDGTSWTRTSSPSPDAKINKLAAVDIVNGSTNAWAVGNTKKKTLTMRICPVRVTDSAISPATAQVADGSTVAWSFPESNGSNHRVTDTSGLGLYDSGSRAPGYSFTTQFTAAGTYPYSDPPSGRTGKIQVPVNVVPSSGGQNDFFTASWAFNTATAPYVYDVQVKGPADSAYLPWQTGNTTGVAVFQPSSWQGGEGAGHYRFRARLRNTNTGAMTDWSPAATITVT